MTPFPADALRRRVNPFAFWSDTDARFLLLVVLIALAAAEHFWTLLLGNIAAFNRHYFSVLEACARSMFARPLSPEGANWYMACVADVMQELKLGILVGVLALFVVAYAVASFMPRWTIWRRRAQPIPAQLELNQELLSLCREAELGRSPEFLWSPLERGTNAVALGGFRRRYVILPGGLLKLLRSHRSVFRAVMLHELAHIKNGDVWKAQATLALGAAYLLLAVLPSWGFRLVSIISGGSPGGVLQLAWDHGVLSLAVVLLLASVLRSREHAADVFSCASERDSGLHHALRGLPEPRRGGFFDLFRLHPRPSLRVAAIENPARLLDLRLGTVFGAGAVFAFARGPISTWFSQGTPAYRGCVAAVFVVCVVGVAGLGMWRASFARALGAGSGVGPGRVAWMAVLGIASVELLQRPFDGSRWLGLLGWLPLGVALHLVLLWIRASAAAWLPVASGFRSPRVVLVAWFVVAVTLVFGAAYFVTQTAFAGGVAQYALMAAQLTVEFWNLPLAFFVVLLWLFPLCSALFSHKARQVGAASWAYLHAELPAPNSLSWRVTPSLRGTLYTSVLAGLIGTAIIILLRIWLRVSGLSEAINQDPEKAFSALLVSVWISAVVQTVAAVWTARRVPGGWAHGLAAAFATGVVISIGWLLANLAFGGSIDLAFARMVACSTLNAGAILACVPVALTAKALPRESEPVPAAAH